MTDVAIIETLGELLSPSQGKHLHDVSCEVVLPLPNWLDRADLQNGRMFTSKQRNRPRSQTMSITQALSCRRMACMVMSGMSSFFRFVAGPRR